VRKCTPVGFTVAEDLIPDNLLPDNLVSEDYII